MADANETDGALPTDLGEGRKAREITTGLPRIDLNDLNQVFELAGEIVRGNRLRQFQVTHAEQRRVALLAVIGFPVFTHALELVRRIDNGNGDAVYEQQQRLIAEMRRMMEALNVI